MERKSCLLKNRKIFNHLIHVKIFISVNSVNVSMCYFLRGRGVLKALLRFIHTKQFDSYYEESGETIFRHNILLLKQLHTSVKKTNYISRLNKVK